MVIPYLSDNITEIVNVVSVTQWARILSGPDPAELLQGRLKPLYTFQRRYIINTIHSE